MSDNHAGGSGSAISTTNTVNVNIEDSLFIDNSANIGGAVRSGFTTIIGSTLRNNAARIGGSVEFRPQRADCRQRILHDNVSSENGGAVAIDRAALQIINSTLSGNAADNFGGGVWSYGVNNSVAMFHSTMTDNTADANSSGVGGGGGNWVDDGGAVTLDNTLVAAKL